MGNLEITIVTASGSSRGSLDWHVGCWVFGYSGILGTCMARQSRKTEPKRVERTSESMGIVTRRILGNIFSLPKTQVGRFMAEITSSRGRKIELLRGI